MPRQHTIPYTPGPWHVETDREDSDGYHCDIRVHREGSKTAWGVASIWHQSGGAVDNSESDANATLIAAAPRLAEELLKAHAALQAVYTHCRAMGIIPPCLDGVYDSLTTAEPLLAEVGAKPL